MLFSAACLSLWSVAVPVFESPDESAHWLNGRFIHDHWRLPVLSETLVEASQPPLYYLLLAPFAVDSPLPASQPTLDTSGKPTGCCTDGRLYPNKFSDLEGFGALRIARLFSVAFSLITILFTYLACLELLGEPHVAFLAGSLIAFLPQFSFRGGSISNDAPAATLGAACLFAAIYIYRRGFTWKRGMIAGILLGLACLTKINAVCLSAALVIAIVRFEGEFKKNTLRISVLGISLALLAPWMIYSQIVLGDPLGMQAVQKVLPSLVEKRTLADPYFRTVFPETMWLSSVGLFSHMSMPMRPWAYHAIATLLAIAGLGLAIGLVRRKLDGRIVALLGSPVIVNLMLVDQYNLTFAQPQGRLLFPSLPCVAVLVALGLRNLVQLPAFSYAGLAAGALVFNVAVLTTVVIPGYWSSANEATAIDLQVNPGGSMVPAGPLSVRNSLRQTFVAGHDNLSGIQILIATYSAHVQQGVLLLTLSAEEEAGSRVIARGEIPAASLEDNHPARWYFPVVHNAYGRRFALTLSSDELPEDRKISAWLSGTQTYPAGRLFLEGREQPRSLVLTTFFRLAEW
jgi:4-amino-4-deoxy-L-arabinose transferase-like glycosyltransferase